MEFVIWGIGRRAKKFIEQYGLQSVIAFIDSDPNKLGKFNGKNVITFDEYLKYYSDEIIVVTPLDADAIIEQLSAHDIFHYINYLYEPFAIRRFEDLKKELKKNSSVGVYGLSCFGLRLIEELYERCEFVNLILGEDIDENFKSILIKKLPCKILSERTDKKAKYDYLFIVSAKQNKAYIDSVSCVNKIDCYDFEDTSNINPNIKKLKGIYKGKRCFIVATGPSLTINDLDILDRNNVYCISMNRIFYSFPDTKWRPNCLVVEDNQILKEYSEEIKSADVNLKLCSDSSSEFWNSKDIDKILKFHMTIAYDDVLGLKFSENIEKKVYCGFTVTYACIQIAAYMGFSEIILLGVDFKFSANHESEGNHFYKQKSKLSNPNGLYLDKNLLAYASAEKYAKKKGIKILNATRGGKLEVFERVDFDSLFEK